MIRKAILERMEEQKLTTYRLAKMLDGKVPKRTLYDFLSGESDTATGVAAAIMEVLGLTIVTKSIVKRGNKKPRKGGS